MLWKALHSRVVVKAWFSFQLSVTAGTGASTRLLLVLTLTWELPPPPKLIAGHRLGGV